MTTDCNWIVCLAKAACGTAIATVAIVGIFKLVIRAMEIDSDDDND